MNVFFCRLFVIKWQTKKTCSDLCTYSVSTLRCLQTIFGGGATQPPRALIESIDDDDTNVLMRPPQTRRQTTLLPQFGLPVCCVCAFVINSSVRRCSWPDLPPAPVSECVRHATTAADTTPTPKRTHRTTECTCTRLFGQRRRRTVMLYMCVGVCLCFTNIAGSREFGSQPPLTAACSIDGRANPHARAGSAVSGAYITYTCIMNEGAPTPPKPLPPQLLRVGLLCREWAAC